MYILAASSFLAFGSLLVLFGANASEIIRALALDYADFGLIASMLSLGIGCGVLGSGPIIDRYPRRPLFVLACVVVAASTFSLGLETTRGTILIVSFTIGLAAGAYETLINAVVIENAGRDAPRKLLFVHAAATAGAALTPFVIGLLKEALSLAWYESFRAAGIFHIVLMLCTPLLPNSVGGSATKSAPSTRDRDPHARLLMIAICTATFVYVGIESALTFFVAEYAEAVLGLAPGRSAGVIGFFWGGLLVGRLRAGLSSTVPSARRSSILALASGAVVGAFFFVGGIPAELAMALTGYLLGSVFPLMIGIAGLTLPNSPGTAIGLAAGLGSVGGFTLPWLTGLLATRVPLAVALSTLSIWLVALALASAVVHRRRRV